MRIHVFVPNKYGKIELTKEELEKLLNESYQQGWNDKPSGYYYNQPYYTLTGHSSVCGSATTIDTATTATGEYKANEASLGYKDIKSEISAVTEKIYKVELKNETT